MLDCSSGVGAQADHLSEVLQELRLEGGSYGRCELTAPWGIDFAPQAQARFHMVIAGSCWLREGKRWRALATGDVVLLPHGTGHTMAAKPTARTKALEDMPLEEIGERTYRMEAGGAGAETILVCCSVTFAHAGMQPLLGLMPRVILLRDAEKNDPVLHTIVDVMTTEVLEQRLGHATIMVRLADVLIARTIRAWAESRRDAAHGWLAAVRDPRVGRAIAAIHQRPGERWSLASLSRVAGASRSVFAERFMDVVGMPPARYVAAWRMRLACEWLGSRRVTVAEAAARLGYDSEAAFSRAFKRFTGRPPSAVRREGAAPGARTRKAAPRVRRAD